MKKTFLLSCLMLAAMPVMAAYTGHVYVDKNKNGVFDQSEKPLAGIKVSDGLNVVETAADGSFTLPGHERERFIFITTPSGYKTFNRHYHKIEKKQSGYDFGLIPYSGRIRKDGSHRYIHQFDMSLQAFFIADIPGMNDKSRLFIPGIVTHIIHPVRL